jgi:chemotaxis protein methyltransferase CheR
MSNEEFLLIRDLIFEHCGIFMPENVKFLLERRLRPRLDASNTTNYRDYYRAVKYARDRTRELEEIVELITTNETYFFREQHQLLAFTQELVPAVIAKRHPSDPVRIWSAGCSSGEEPYTLAMLLAEMALPTKVSYEIFGSDISRKVLRMARAGTYRESAFRETDPRMVDRYFVRSGREFQLRDEIRNKVTFGLMNLMDDAALALVANVDIIFCRNVMIYFSKASRTKLLAAFYRKLRAGGYLLLGHSESLVNASTDFEIVALKNDIVYRKPLAAAGRPYP